jgi:transcriptional regulator with XRE-family HTH domain
MEQADEQSNVPAICVRIRKTRERLSDEWKAANPGQRGNPFTQERIAARMGLTTKSYGDYERGREPDLQRLREIALAFSLDEDYFAPSGDLASATARVEAEADRFAKATDQVEDLLAALRAQLGVEPAAPPLAEPDG